MACGDIGTSKGTLQRYAHFDDDCNLGSRADPMNMLFTTENADDLEDTFHRITNVDKGKKWKNPSWFFMATARDQWLHIDGECKEQDVQCVVGWIWDRFHIRLWNIVSGGSNNVIANAHHENLLTIGGNLPLPHGHQPDSFDAGKESVCDDFLGLGRPVSPRELPLNNYQRLPNCDGIAALIEQAR
jgi:hypothetical protein